MIIDVSSIQLSISYHLYEKVSIYQYNYWKLSISVKSMNILRKIKIKPKLSQTEMEKCFKKNYYNSELKMTANLFFE